MLQKTSWSVRRAWMSDSSPAMVALLSASIFFAGGQTSAADDIAGHAARTVPPRQLLQETSSGSTHPGSAPTAALRSTPAMQPTVRHAEAEVATYEAHDVTGAPAAITGPVRKRTWSSAGGNRTTTVRSNSRVHKMERGNSIEMPASGRKITRVSAENFEQPMEMLPPVSETLATAPETWSQEYATHVDDVLTGGACRCEQESVGVWWERRLPTIEMVTIEPGQLKQSARNFIDNHTLPPEHDYDVDVYDQKPIAVTSAQSDVAQVPKKIDGSDKDADEPGKNRLKTDIRKIRPTLSYAMRNIEESQLPAGFHEKLDNGQYVARQASPAVLQWAPTNLYYHPLYFEDPSLERYGHTYHPVVQPIASAGRFATQLVGLPYQMALHPVHSREYALGYYRPGECAPKKLYQIPFNEEAAVVQAAAMVGFFLIFP